MNIPMFTLLALLLLISGRAFLPWRIPIWVMMLTAAIIVLAARSITLTSAYYAVDFNVILYLFCMFILGHALERSGYLAQMTQHLIARFHRTWLLVLSLVFFAGLASALLMNDTVAIILTPLILLLCRYTRIPLVPMLLLLAYSVTIGSTLSPIGNPQNLLIAMHADIPQSLLVFLKYLLIPSLVNLGICFLWCYGLGRRRMPQFVEMHAEIELPILDKYLQRLAKISLFILCGLMLFKLISELISSYHLINYDEIAVLSALPFLFAKQRWQLIKHIDWGTLVFFIAMFVFMRAVWDAGTLQYWLHAAPFTIKSTASIFSISVIGSQLISNVPLVALYLPLLKSAGAQTGSIMALAAGATIAGNFLILGAASNIIVLANAEKRGVQGFTAGQFMRVGIPLGIVNLLVYYGYFKLIGLC